MKTFLLLLSLICLEANAQWSDSFADGNFTSNSSWFGDSAKFIVNPLFQLQLNAPAVEGSAYLSTSSDVCYKSSWAFKIRMEFNPSAQNYAKVYLMSNVSNFTEPLYGYYLKVGSVNDDLCLYKQQGLKQTLIADGRDKMFNTNVVNVQIRVERDDSCNWSVYCDTTGGENFNLTARGNDNSILGSSYFGIQCFYSQTRSSKFSFDDFYVTGEKYSDGTKPYVESFTVIDEKRVQITFSEPVDSLSSYNIFNFSLENKNPAKILFDNTTKSSVELTFTDSFSCGRDNLLQIKAITDLYGLAINDTVISYQFCKPQLFDIVFNELMIDPSPTQGLPDAEYLELYNRSNKSFDLTGWHLFIGSKVYIFPKVQLVSDSYLLVTSKSKEPDFSILGKTIGLFTSSTALNNTNQFLRLENSEGQLIAWLEYDVSWHDNELKAEGGWSLEQIDPWNVCRGKSNWRSSCGEGGGTPGSKNSIYKEEPDIINPYVNRIHVPADTLVDIYFNEPMDSILAGNVNNYEIVPDIGAPKATKVTDRQFLSLRLFLKQPLNPGQTYTLKVGKSLIDCAGNTIAEEQNLPIGMPVRPDSADIVINEVLFNAHAGGSDYVELYNRSGKILNAQQILIGLKNNGIAEHLVRLSETGFLIFPSSYLLLTSNIERVKAFYKVEDDRNFVELPQMPALDDYTATIILLNDTLENIDEFSYSAKMHLASLKDVEGISLERINTDNPSYLSSNWISAAETAGYGTPGYQNSQFLSDTTAEQVITLVDALFSPDNDGNKDMLQILYQFDKPGCRVQVYVFDAMGRLVRRLLNNELLGTQGSFVWDGINEAGRRCSLGMYIIFIRTVFDDGTVREYKKPCILATKK